jgi:hypothetical protein
MLKFDEWWSSEDVDGYTPRLYIHSLIQNVGKAYKEKKFSFIMPLPDIELRVTKYFSLLFKIVYTNLQKKIETNIQISLPENWSDRDENEWRDAYWHYFDSLFWEQVMGPEKSWENRIIKWRYTLPAILQDYTMRSRNNLPHIEEDIYSDGEYESYQEHD